MKKRYVKPSLFETTQRNMVLKKKRMEQEVFQNTGKKVNIPLTNIYDAVSKKQINFNLREIFCMTKRRRR